MPDSLEVKYNIAVIDEAQGKYDDAITILNQLLQKTEHANGEYDASEKNNRADLPGAAGHRLSRRQQAAVGDRHLPPHV